MVAVIALSLADDDVRVELEPRTCKLCGRATWSFRCRSVEGSDEFRTVVVKELGNGPWGAAGDLLEGAGRVVVLAGENGPLTRDEQLSRPRRYPGAGEATPVQVREVRTSRAAASSDAEKIAGRIVEYGTPVEEANWSML